MTFTLAAPSNEGHRSRLNSNVHIRTCYLSDISFTACQSVGIGYSPSYRPLVNWAQRDAAVIGALTTLGATKLRWRVWKYVDQPWHTGHRGNHPRLPRVYCQLRLKSVAADQEAGTGSGGLATGSDPTAERGRVADFTRETLPGERRCRTLNLRDKGVREVFTNDVDTSLLAERIIRVRIRETMDCI